MKFSFYSKPEYFAELHKQIAAAGKDDEVYLMAMAFRPQFPEIAKLVEILCAAAKRGANVQLILDSTTFKTGRRSWVKARRNAKQKLEASGAKVSLVNGRQQKFSNPYSGRLHAKVTVINDQLFIGGCNLNQQDQIDLMVGWRDAKQAQELSRTLNKIRDSGSVRGAFQDQDQIFKVDGRTKLMFDAGIRKQSSIYNLALQAIDDARQNIFAALYFFPTGQTFSHLQTAAKRGVKIRLLHNQPAKYELVYRLIYTAISPIGKRLTHKSILAEELSKGLPLMHSKFLVADNTTIVGSHNLAPSGVNWGTAETALVSTSPDFAKSAKSKLEQILDSES